MPEGWWVVGGDINSRIVGGEDVVKASSSGMLKRVLNVMVLFQELMMLSNGVVSTRKCIAG